MEEKEKSAKARIREGIGKLGEKTIKSDKLFFTFLRSIVSSQAASWVDLGVGFVFFAWVGLNATWSTAIGAVLGGAVNCVINYKFTFHADGLDWKAVIVKYAMVWIGSALLNTFGTGLLYLVIRNWDWLESIGFKRDGYYAAARLFVSLMVSWFWNFPMQKYFVYTKRRFDDWALSLLTFFKKPTEKTLNHNEY